LAQSPVSPGSSIVERQYWRTASPGFRLVKLWNRELHAGDIGGLPTRILASLISLSLPVMTITGPLIWWNRRRKLVPVTQSDQ
jgi:uncharacterized iron-regulated membrane protein